MLGLVVVCVVAALMVATAGRASGFEVMAVLLLIALLTVRELTAPLTTRAFRARYDVFVWSGLGVFVLIVVNRVRAILGL